MKVIKRRIMVEISGGRCSQWMNEQEFKRYRSDQVKAVVIEETMSYADAIAKLGLKEVSKALDDVISESLASKPASIMGP